MNFNQKSNKLTSAEKETLVKISSFATDDSFSNAKRILRNALERYAGKNNRMLILLEDSIIEADEREDGLRDLTNFIKEKDVLWNQIGNNPLFGIHDQFVFTSGINKGEVFTLEPISQMGSISYATAIACCSKALEERKFQKQLSKKEGVPTLDLKLRLCIISFDDDSLVKGSVGTMEVRVYITNGALFSSNSDVEMSKFTSTERELDKSELMEDDEIEIDDYDDFER